MKKGTNNEVSFVEIILNSWQFIVMTTHSSEFPLYFGSEIQRLSRTLKLHFQGPILDRSLQHGQYYSNI